MKGGCKFILNAVAILILLSLLGCSESSRKTAAERRWNRTLEQARIEAAQAGIEQGRLAYARHILQDCVETDSPFSAQAEQMLAQLKTVEQQIAQARVNTPGADGSLVN